MQVVKLRKVGDAVTVPLARQLQYTYVYIFAHILRYL